MNERIPVPIEAILAAISKIMHENVGSFFDLEIKEGDSGSFRGGECHRIDILLTIESDLPETNEQTSEPKKQPAFSA